MTQCQHIMQAHYWPLFLCLLAFVQAGPYSKKQRPVAKSPLVSAAQWFLRERLLAVEMRLLEGSVHVARLAEDTTGEAYRMTDEAWALIQELSDSLQAENRKYKPLMPQCTNMADIRKAVDMLKSELNGVLECTHAVADTAAVFEVDMTNQLSDVRNQIWDVQEAMYYCEKFTPEVDVKCLRRMTVEGLQVLNRLPDRVRQVMEGAEAARAQSQDLLGECYAAALSRAQERRLAESQKMRVCVEKVRESRRKRE